MSALENFYNKVEKRGFKIDKTMWQGKKSNTSKALVVEGQDQPCDLLKGLSSKDKCQIISNIKKYDKAALKNAFNVDVNDKKLNSILDGKGSEWRKIRTLHSSSLCGYLHFKNVSENNVFKLGDHTFSDVKFEYETPCIDSNSSIDVVLTNKEEILFLELKFSEYLSSSESTISDKYIKYYKDIFGWDSFDKPLFKDIYLKKNDKDSYDMFCKSSKKPYVGGLKQVISHFIAINKFCENNKDKIGKIYYAELVFKLDEAKEKFNLFESYYKELIRILSKKYSNINILNGDKPFVYKEVFLDNANNKKLLDKKVEQFYY